MWINTCKCGAVNGISTVAVDGWEYSEMKDELEPCCCTQLLEGWYLTAAGVVHDTKDITRWVRYDTEMEARRDHLKGLRPMIGRAKRRYADAVAARKEAKRQIQELEHQMEIEAGRIAELEAK